MKTYNEDSIVVLDDITHIQQRPTMYIDSSRPHYQMFNEIFDNALDEAMNGYATTIRIRLDYESNYFLISDNGRGIPQGMNKEMSIPTPQVIYLNLNSGGKYNRENYGVSSGLNGVGSVVVNALSSDFIVDTWRGSSSVTLRCEKGVMVQYLESENLSLEGTSGTTVFCLPDLSHKLFSDRFYDYEQDISDRISLMKTLLPKVKFLYNDKEVEKKDFKDFLKEPSNPLLEEPVSISTKDLEVAINWSKDNNRYLTKCFCNSVYNPAGGDHEKGVYDALLEVFGNQDFSLGISFVVSVLYPDVEFDTQSKLKAVSKDLRVFVKEKVTDLLKKYLKQHPEVQSSVESLIKLKRREIDKKNNKSSVKRDRKSSFLNSLGANGFADCSTKNREEAELYLCEGLSAAGSLKQSRSVEKQAVMPLRGKFINAFTSNVKALLNNREVMTIVSSIDAGVFQDVNMKRARYGKIIIATDADPDGKNIAVLLLAFFMHTMAPLVEQGYLYLALPPLYGTTVKGKFIPINTEEEKDEYVKKGCEITRFKGLGEMSAEQLRISCMQESTRQLLQITSSDDCYDIILKIAGGNSSYRKELLIEEGVLA